tara:strand:- start:1316 stop:1894 length:579 start_codon:yes stop_codon:yes gene_type:complete
MLIYGFINNDVLNLWDFLGLKDCCREIRDAITLLENDIDLIEQRLQGVNTEYNHAEERFRYWNSEVERLDPLVDSAVNDSFLAGIASRTAADNAIAVCLVPQQKAKNAVRGSAQCKRAKSLAYAASDKYDRLLRKYENLSKSISSAIDWNNRFASIADELRPKIIEHNESLVRGRLRLTGLEEDLAACEAGN